MDGPLIADVQWAQIPDCAGNYEASSEGDIRRVSTGRILKPRRSHVDDLGYVYVVLYENGVPHYRYIHQLVARVFIGPCPDGYEVNHRDARPSNNRLANLEYIPWQENRRTGSHKDTCPKGHPYAGLNVIYERNRRTGRLVQRCRQCQYKRQWQSRRSMRRKGWVRVDKEG